MRHVLGIFRSTLGRQFDHVAPLWSEGFAALQIPAFKCKDDDEKRESHGDNDSTHHHHYSKRLKIEESPGPSEIEFEVTHANISVNARVSDPTALLSLPADILFLLSDHLDTTSVHSLSVTCRALYGAGFPKTRTKLEPEDKKELLLLLEKDPISNGHYYCSKCNKLHTFKETYGPRSQEELLDKSAGFACGMRDRFTPMGNPYDLGYHHARLVMNRHFYGPKHGIPLKNICVQHESKREKTTINCSTAANIINDELFVRRTYSFTVTNTDAAAFRHCTGHRDFRLCEHLPFFRNSSIYHQAIPELQRRPRAASSKDEFVPCTNSPGSCGLCLLDYDVTISRAEAGTAWRVKINTYHQLGDCRSPDDWKWARFTEKSRPHLFLPNRPNRRGSGFNPGAIKKIWLQGDVRSLEDANIANLKRHSV